MMLSLILPLLLLGASTPESHPSATPPARPESVLAVRRSITDSLKQVRRWLRRREPVTDPRELERMERALGELDHGWGQQPERRGEIQLALLDFLGRSIEVADAVATRKPDEWGPPLTRNSGEAKLHRRTREILRRRLPEIREWLTHEVLLLEREHPPERRIAACEVVARDQSPEVVLALFACTRSSPRAVRVAAIEALEGREDPEVHRRMIELLARADRGEADVPRGPLERHFAGITLTEEAPATVSRVRDYVRGALASEDWRQASRGVSIAHCLPHDPAFPVLISGMETWLERAGGETPVRRVLGEIEAELQHRSGRGLGLHPRRWKALWEGFRRGDIALKDDQRVGATITQAEFFGLRPITDRVVFVLDRSGSMTTGFGRRSNHSRLKEAAARLTAYLDQLGPSTRFSVIVFSDRAITWHDRLHEATEKNIRAASAWVLHLGADGGTHLRAGVLSAMCVDSSGELDLEQLEADTVIVLCDGATSEGPGWVEPLLRRVNGEARLVFHAVQIGRGGDGTLQALCELTGGDFVEIDG